MGLFVVKYEITMPLRFEIAFIRVNFRPIRGSSVPNVNKLLLLLLLFSKLFNNVASAACSLR